MFSVEVKFKVQGREVSPERFAELFLLEGLRSAQEQLQPKNLYVPPPVPTTEREYPQKGAPETKAVGINDAARILGLRPSTIRRYVALRKIASVRIGRRVLIPTQGIDELIRKGLQPAR